MSTKSTIVCGAKFHLYTECFDGEEHAWLEIENPTAFEVHQPEIPVKGQPAAPGQLRVVVRLTGDVLRVLMTEYQEEAERRAKSIRAFETEPPKGIG
jgi:hypothetical protein